MIMTQTADPVVAPIQFACFRWVSKALCQQLPRSFTAFSQGINHVFGHVQVQPTFVFVEVDVCNAVSVSGHGDLAVIHPGLRGGKDRSNESEQWVAALIEP